MGGIAVRSWRSCSAFVPLYFFGLSAYPREWRPQSCTEIGVARPCCFHGSCRGSRGHMFQNHNLARLKAGLRSTLWWNMWLSCIACMMVSKWNLADRDGLISFQDRVFTSPFPFCKRWSGSIGLFFRGREGGSSYFLHSCSGREFRRGTETDRIRKSRAWGS